jgi:hypothetical protein
MGRISPAFFIIVVISFLLPFVRITCDGQEMAKMTGLDLATGAEVKVPGMEEEAGEAEEGEVTIKPSDREPEPLAIAALACAIVGIVLGIATAKKAPILPGIMGIVGIVMLVLLRFSLEGDMGEMPTEEGMSGPQIEYMYGYWLAIAGFALAAIVSLLAQFKGKKEPAAG